MKAQTTISLKPAKKRLRPGMRVHLVRKSIHFWIFSKRTVLTTIVANVFWSFLKIPLRTNPCILLDVAASQFIGIEVTKRFKERKTEISASERTYCSNKTCSRYIPPYNIRRGVGTCQFCTARTCTGCKKQGHRGDCNSENANKQRIARDRACVWLHAYTVG
ncbi:hypothetical protein N7449_003984 [Penicillium cf. viridicatum]|uniref:IBR domain-containing protein n=1 Tax=Penicillium cf. viridicatum TaxID=2972119 RepID=A0A9W9MXY7_9EURO|nr:hypothetical protein N7449_003984 [Penicillium cf. viridicatum]